MITEDRVVIDAPAALVWQVFSDVEHWPQWTASVTSLRGHDGPNLAVGKRFSIAQPGMMTLTWTVTEVEPTLSWTWVQRSPGSIVSARHWVTAQLDGRTQVRQQLDQRGMIGVLVAKAMAPKTRLFLRQEAEGLKSCCEQLHRARGPLT